MKIIAKYKRIYTWSILKHPLNIWVIGIWKSEPSQVAFFFPFYSKHMGEFKRLCVSATVCHKFSRRKEGQSFPVQLTLLFLLAATFDTCYCWPPSFWPGPVSNFIVCLNIYTMKTKRFPCVYSSGRKCLRFLLNLQTFFPWLRGLWFMLACCVPPSDPQKVQFYVFMIFYIVLNCQLWAVKVSRLW